MISVPRKPTQIHISRKKMYWLHRWKVQGIGVSLGMAWFRGLYEVTSTWWPVISWFCCLHIGTTLRQTLRLWWKEVCIRKWTPGSSPVRKRNFLSLNSPSRHCLCSLAGITDSSWTNLIIGGKSKKVDAHTCNPTYSSWADGGGGVLLRKKSE